MSIQVNQSTQTSGGQLQIQNFKQQNIKKLCRICLVTQKQSSQLLINPCKCSGTLKYVHQACYFQWIKHIYTRLETQSEKQQMENQGFQCQICKTKLKAKFKTKRQIVNQIQFKEICKNSIPLTITIVVFFLIAIAAFAYLVYFADLTKQQFQNGKLSQAFFTILSIIIIVLFFGAGVFFLVFHYIWVAKIKIKQVIALI